MNDSQLHLPMLAAADTCCCRDSVDVEHLVEVLAPRLARLLRAPSPATWRDGERLRFTAHVERVERVERRGGAVVARLATEPFGELAVLVARADVEGFRAVERGARIAVLGRVELVDDVQQLPRAIALAIADTDRAKTRKAGGLMLDPAVAKLPSSVNGNGKVRPS